MYAVSLNTPEKPRLSLLVGDGMFYTPLSSFFTVLMIFPVSSSLSHAPFTKDSSILRLGEYTRESEIESSYWICRYMLVLYSHLILDDLSSIISSFVWSKP